METNKTLVCPNCGASSANLDKCEYCGSILVKIASVLVPSSEDTKSEMKKLGFGNTLYVDSRILERIEKCISLSERFNIVMIMPLFVHDKHFRIELNCTPKTSYVLKLCFNMDDYHGNRFFNMFESSQISEMFEIFQNGNWMYCSVVLDNDARTITQFIQYILRLLDEQTSSIVIGFLTTYLNNYKYLFKRHNGRPIEFVYDEYFKTDINYENYVKMITINNSSWAWHLLQGDYPYDKALYDIVFADSLMRCRVDESYKKKFDVETRFLLSEEVMWSSQESKQKYIAKCKEICSRYYFCKNIFLHAGYKSDTSEPKHLFKDGEKYSCGNNVFGVIREDYDPQVYGPIEEYIKREEDKIRQEEVSDIERIASEMQRRHNVVRSGFSLSSLDYNQKIVLFFIALILLSFIGAFCE